MYCPHSVIRDGDWLFILRHESADHYAGTPWPERLNPLRYEFTFFPRTRWTFKINPKGRWQLRWANFNWWLWKRRVWEYRNRPRPLLCLGGHEWTGHPSSCCPVCARRASTHKP